MSLPAKLQALAALRRDGALTEHEFSQAKAALLAGGAGVAAAAGGAGGGAGVGAALAGQAFNAVAGDAVAHVAGHVACEAAAGAAAAAGFSNPRWGLLRFAIDIAACRLFAVHEFNSRGPQ